MLAAGCVAIAVFLATRPSPRIRCRRIFPRASIPRKSGPPPAVVGMALVAVACLVLFGMPMGVLVAGAAVPVAGRLINRLESNSSRRLRLRIARQLPSAVDLLVAVLDAGAPPAEAFAVVGRATPDPLGREFSVIASRLAVGGDEEAIWRGLHSRPEFAALGRSFGRASRSGMPIAKVLARLAEDLRRTRRAMSEQRARGVAVSTAAPLGLCFLPAFFLIGIVPTLIGAFSSLRW